MKRGFTLIELLVVIAIIAILAAVLFPVFLSAKEQAKLAGCSANLKQIGNAYAMYVDEYNGWYPAAARSPLLSGETLIDPAHQQPNVCTWDIAISKYIKSLNVFKCPADTISRTQSTSRELLPRSYAVNDQPRVQFNSTGSWDRQKPWWCTAAMKPKLSHYILLVELPKSSAAENTYGSWSWSSVGCETTIGEAVHKSGKVMNYLFFDGHVKAMNPKIAQSDPHGLWGYLPSIGDDKP